MFVDSNENAVRFGFGDKEAVDLLLSHIEILNVQTVEHIRLSIVIVDDSVLIYTPVALSWEKTPEKLNFPNGFVGGEEVVASILPQMNGETGQIVIDENSGIPFQICPVPQKGKEVIKKELTEQAKKLEENPPVDPSTLRKTTFIEINIKYLECQSMGGR